MNPTTTNEAKQLVALHNGCLDLAELQYQEGLMPKKIGTTPVVSAQIDRLKVPSNTIEKLADNGHHQESFGIVIHNGKRLLPWILLHNQVRDILIRSLFQDQCAFGQQQPSQGKRITVFMILKALSYGKTCLSFGRGFISCHVVKKLLFRK